ncbi:hypothetical protein J3A72_001447 [Stenotrophomonas sp. PvP093]|jgi:hypothetical protein|uniref:AbiJ-NTD4 domain-containing protein n=1 Tax=Stenotrophomonas TaxID=40323 RepID=UPI0007B1FF48|nr:MULTISPECIES: hypothetical protein [Stenotrophomonas]KZE53900.1 hypothetical protein AVW14_08990 [Stenotrophomonas maltophilia]MBP2481155.1 hypothetical protein [Stenotrophomonas sp. PvP093]MCF3544280.1 hypothetical protein [Stenotrophomonas maltophilia]MCU1118922.1 hypothetical protein [Stenotrophomonas maltophilia]MCU1129958.1 hypothetical protein [Stenotrophomonas maltophilia]
MKDYFSDREHGARPRTEQEMTPTAWAGIVALVEALANGGAFGHSYPEQCADGGVCGNDIQLLNGAIEAELHGLSWPLQTQHDREPESYRREMAPWCPPTLLALDLIEFVWRKVAKPIQIGKYHEYARHYHLTFNQDGGRTEFREEVNLILARNGLAYELTAYGSIRRLLPAVIGEALARTYFRTGERTLDVLLEESCVKFSDPDPLIRREALERLFDSWERIKSMADDNDKAKSIAIILDRCATEPEFRKMLDAEARELTRIGNSHLFRHHEMKQTPVVDVQQVDYLYHRLFAMVELVIRKNAPR